MPTMKWKTTKVANLLKDENSGRYYARFWRDGKPKWLSLKTDVFTTAKIRIDKERKNFNAITETVRSVEVGDASVAKCAQAYLDQVDARVDIKKSSAEYYHYITKSILKSWPELKITKPKDISRRDLELWSKRFSEQCSAQRFNNAINVLRLIFQIAVDQGVMYKNPADFLGKARITQKHITLPTADQLNQIVAHIRKQKGWCAKQSGDLIEFLAFTGCRIDEARNVRWSDVKDNGIWIHGGETGTKNSLSRHLPMNTGLARLLSDLKANPRYRETTRSADFVMAIRECPKGLAHACTALNIPHLTHHDLRHWFATQAISKGVDVPTVARWLGHKDGGALLMRTYSHLLQEHSTAMAAKLAF